MKARTETRDANLVDTYFTIAVEGTAHLKSVLSSLKKIKHVHGVKRING